MRILLIGYYGKANFGDDVLFKVTYNYVRQCKPSAEIFVLCDQYQEEYLEKLVRNDINIVKPGNRDHYDVIIHGGGGTFFDFNQYGMIDRFINILIMGIGLKNTVKIDKIVRNLLNKQRISSDKRLGWGIGVGTYSTGSKKLRDNLSVLLDFDTLILRDVQSVQNLKKLGIISNVRLGSDLAFLDEYWVPKESCSQNKVKKRKKLGLVLRDWETGEKDKYFEAIVRILPQLNETYEMTIFIFDKRVDKKKLMLSRSYTTYLWNPLTIDFDDFCTQLATQDVLVTTRAHGAICGAVLGVPSVIIELEPKLKTIHEMLPNITSLIDINQLDFARLEEQIEEILKCEKETIMSDCQHNKKLIEKEVFSSIVQIGLGN